MAADFSIPDMTRPNPAKNSKDRTFFKNSASIAWVRTQNDDEQIYDRPDHKHWNFGAVVTDDGRYLIIHVYEGTNHNLVFYRDLQSKSGVVELVSTFEANYQFIGSDGPTFWFLTDHEAPLGKVIGVDTSEESAPAFHALVPETNHTLTQVTAVGDFFLANYLANAHTKVKGSDPKRCVRSRRGFARNRYGLGL
jgi:prolyl oligopeptidase